MLIQFVKKRISYIDKKFEQNSVSCEKCNMWYHVECVGIEDKNNVSKESDIWNCINCSVIFKIFGKEVYMYINTSEVLLLLLKYFRSICKNSS